MDFQKIKSVIEKAEKIALTTHLNADGDGLASMLAMYHALQKQGKEVVMFLNENVEGFAFLQGIENIKQYDGFVADLWVVLDIDPLNKERLGVDVEVLKALVLNIDHHETNAQKSAYCLMDAMASATGEIVWRLFHKADWIIDKTVANLLFTAIASDTGFFRFANTTKETFLIAADLMQKGALPQNVANNLEAVSVKAFQALAKIFETLEFHKEGKVAVVSVKEEFMLQLPKGNDLVVNNLRNLKGVEMSIVLKEKNINETRVSIRTKETNALELAKYFGGGGHLCAAGCTIASDLAVAKEKILKKVCSY